MRLLTIGLSVLLVATLSCSVQSNSALSMHLSTAIVPTGSPTPSLHPTTSPMASPLNCPHTPLGGFYDVWSSERVQPRLGCAVAPAEPITGTEAYLCCMHSIWVREKNLFVVVQDFQQKWVFTPDESRLPSDQPLMLEPVPRSKPCFPATGRHGWLASSYLWVEQCSGESRSGEVVFHGAIQQFEGGWLLWNGNVCFVLFADGTWMI